MARNYTVAEAVKIISENKDFESIRDIGARYPLFAVKVSANIAKAGDAFVDLMSFFPEYFSVNKLNKLIKDSLLNSEDTDNEDAEAEVEEQPKAKGKKKATKEDGPYDGKSAMDLFKECKKRGLKVKPKLKAEDYAKALIADDEAKANADDDDWEEEDVKPAKAKGKGKAKKEAEPEPEEDDDWDI